MQLMCEDDLQATSADVMSVLRELDTVDSNDGTVFVAGLSAFLEPDAGPDGWKGTAFGITCHVIEGEGGREGGTSSCHLRTCRVAEACHPCCD